MMSIIRDGSVARTACGTFAGISTIDCGAVRTSRPPIVSTRAPDSVRTSASKGAVCSDSSSPASKAKSVMLPAAVRARTRLAMPCAVGVTRPSNANGSAGGSVLAMTFFYTLRLRPDRGHSPLDQACSLMSQLQKSPSGEPAQNSAHREVRAGEARSLSSAAPAGGARPAGCALFPPAREKSPPGRRPAGVFKGCPSGPGTRIRCVSAEVTRADARLTRPASLSQSASMPSSPRDFGRRRQKADSCDRP